MQAVDQNESSDPDPYLATIGETSEPDRIDLAMADSEVVDGEKPAAEAEPPPDEEAVVGGAVAAPMGQYERADDVSYHHDAEVSLELEHLGPDLAEVKDPYFKKRIHGLMGTLTKIEQKRWKLNGEESKVREEIKILLEKDYKILRLEQGSLFELEHQSQVALQQVQREPAPLALKDLPSNCVCGDSSDVMVDHRTDGPCVMKTEEQLLAQNQENLPLDTDPPAAEEQPPDDTVVALQAAKERRAARQRK